jgi:hypothetical protein
MKIGISGLVSVFSARVLRDEVVAGTEIVIRRWVLLECDRPEMEETLQHV